MAASFAEATKDQALVGQQGVQQFVSREPPRDLSDLPRPSHICPSMLGSRYCTVLYVVAICTVWVNTVITKYGNMGSTVQTLNPFTVWVSCNLNTMPYEYVSDLPNVTKSTHTLSD